MGTETVWLAVISLSSWLDKRQTEGIRCGQIDSWRLAERTQRFASGTERAFRKPGQYRNGRWCFTMLFPWRMALTTCDRWRRQSQSGRVRVLIAYAGMGLGLTLLGVAYLPRGTERATIPGHVRMCGRWPFSS